MSNLNPPIDFKAIAAAALARADTLVGQWLPGGKREGYEYKALNPVRGDRRPGSFSINLNTGAWADFATDDCGGDLISLYAYLHGMEQIDAARAVAGFVGIDVPEKSAARKGGKSKKTAIMPPAKKPDLKLVERTPWQPIVPVPEGVAPPPVAHIKRGKPSHTWTYRDAEGRVLGYVCRFETSDGGKEVLPLTWCHNAETGVFDWRWISFPEPRPLYGLDRLHAQPTATVLVVEGEKCADAGADELKELVVISWPGGGNAVDKADWQPLAGRKVMGWADCDAQRERLSATEKADGVDPLTKPLLPAEKQPGVMAMEKVAAQVMKLGCSWWDVKIPAPGDKPDGWDIADAIADGLKSTSLAEFLRTPENRIKRAVPKSVSTPTDAGAGNERDSVFIPDLIYKKGDLASCLSNVYQILAHRPEWRGVLAYDEFSLCVVKRKPPPYALGKEGEWDSTDDTRAAMWLSREYQFTPSSATVAEAVEVLARAHAWHPVRAWLRTLPAWDDGVPRLKTWLTDYLGVPFSGYSSRVGVWWLMGAVKRVLVPGCKFDYCLVLEGNQGKGKSTVFEIIGGEWFGDTDLDLAHKDSMSALRGKMVYEIAELGALARSEEKRQKSFLSRRVDEYRPVYGRREIKAPRQLVFGGSTNDFEWNKDPTGGRRFWPVDCTFAEIDHAGLRSMRDLLFAEAYARVEAGERYWPTMDEQRILFDPEQLKVEQQDSLVDALHDWVYNRSSEFSQAEAMMEGLKLDASKLTRDLQTRIGIALRKLGCARVERRNGMTRFVYKPPVRNEAESSTGQSAQQSGGQGYVDF